MTGKQARKLMTETGSKDLVMKIVKEFNGKSYIFAKKVLDVAAFFIQENCYCDADLANSNIEYNEEGDDDA